MQKVVNSTFWRANAKLTKFQRTPLVHKFLPKQFFNRKNPVEPRRTEEEPRRTEENRGRTEEEPRKNRGRTEENRGALGRRRLAAVTAICRICGRKRFLRAARARLHSTTDFFELWQRLAKSRGESDFWARVAFALPKRRAVSRKQSSQTYGCVY